jgi:hypothetical protein
MVGVPLIACVGFSNNIMRQFDRAGQISPISIAVKLGTMGFFFRGTQ